MTPGLRRWALGWLLLGMAFGCAALLPLSSPWALLGALGFTVGGYLASTTPNGKVY